MTFLKKCKTWIGQKLSIRKMPAEPLFWITSEKAPFALNLIDISYSRICLIMAEYDWETAWVSVDETMETAYEVQRTEGCPVLLLNREYLDHRASFYGDNIQ